LLHMIFSVCTVVRSAVSMTQTGESENDFFCGHRCTINTEYQLLYKMANDW